MRLYNILLLILIVLPYSNQFAQKSKFPALSDNKIIIKGDSGEWDENKVHTLSVVEADREGYKFWGYYGLAYYGNNDAELRKAGLVRSNDLIHWDKYTENPIIENDCRWPTVVMVDSVFYMFYAEYDKDCNSRIVMLSSEDGKDFQNKVVIVPRDKDKQNQNPFIYYNKKDKHFYLTYYSGTERSKDTTRNLWNIMIRKSKNINDLKDAKSKILLSSKNILAAPSITYYNDKYYLLVEAFIYGKWDDKWVTLGYESDKIAGDYKELNNNPPVLFDNDACAFQYVFDNELYIFYSHCIDLDKWDWDLRMVKAEK